MNFFLFNYLITYTLTGITPNIKKEKNNIWSNWSDNETKGHKNNVINFIESNNKQINFKNKKVTIKNYNLWQVM